MGVLLPVLKTGSGADAGDENKLVLVCCPGCPVLLQGEPGFCPGWPMLLAEAVGFGAGGLGGVLVLIFGLGSGVLNLIFWVTLDVWRLDV